MNKRTWKELLKNRSMIWTLSLCLVGVIVLGGIAAVDSSKNKDRVQTETDAGQADEPGEEADSTNDAADAENSLEEVSGNTVDNTSEMDDSDSAAADTDAADPADSESADAASDSAASDVSSSGVSADADTDSEEAASDGMSGDSEEASSAGIISEQALLEQGISFSDDQSLLWPSAGTIVIDYSMDKSVYFATLNQYKYNPALIIGSDTGNQVIASAKGIVESIGIDEETGTTLVLNIGNGYKLTYGQLMEPAVAEGDVVESGALLGYVSEPTKYYSLEGSNLYFQMTLDDEPVDPVLYLE